MLILMTKMFVSLIIDLSIVLVNQDFAKNSKYKIIISELRNLLGVMFAGL